MTVFREALSRGRQDECGPDRLLSSLFLTLKLLEMIVVMHCGTYM